MTEKSKFKVGDRVVLLDHNPTVAIVTKCYTPGFFAIEFETNWLGSRGLNWIHETHLEHAHIYNSPLYKALE